MRNLRNKNSPPSADLVQYFIDTAYDVVKAVYDNLGLLTQIGDAIDNGDLADFLVEADLDTLAKINAILTDAVLGPFSSQAQAEAGTDHTTTMTPLRVSQAIAVLAAGIQNDFNHDGPPLVTDDAAAGFSAGSMG